MNYPFCTDDFESGVYRKPVKQALQKKHIQLNHENCIQYLAFDIDRACSPCEFSDLGLTPNIFIQNPKNRHAHIVFKLETPLHTNDNSSQRAIAYLAAIQNGMTRLLGADAAYNGLLTKNPFHPEHNTTWIHDQVWSFDLLCEYVSPISSKNIAVQEQSSLGRNCTLFDNLRKWAYVNLHSFKHNNPRYNAWLDFVLVQAERLNDNESPLGYAEVNSIAKSVANWVWYKYTGNGGGLINRGRDAIRNVGLNLREKQQMAAEVTNATRFMCTRAKIVLAFRTINKKRKRCHSLPKLTYKYVAAIAGVSASTLHLHLKRDKSLVFG